jgi:outer membrane receptor protein involved in Fe transport
MTFLAWGQNMQPVLKVDGTVIDSATKSPLGYVTVALQDAQTQRPVKSTLTKGDGSFELTAPAGRAYRLTLVFVGYQAKMLPIADTASVVHLGNVLLAAATKQLAAVSITAVKPLIKQEVDRLSYDVQADPDSKIISALDMMRKVPLLSVDASDNIKLRGNSSYKILINGKESAMMATNPSDVLKAMQASNIEKIEVITTPPAKYDAEGLAGIINIITKKNAVQGYNGIVKTEYNTVSGYSVNMGASVKEGKLGYSGFAGTRERRYLGADFENLSSYGGASPSSSQQYGANFTGGHTTYNSNALSYELDSLNLLSGTFNYNESNNRLGNDAVTSVYGNTNSLTNAYHTVNNGTSSNHGADAGLDYQLGFKNNKNELLTASYRYHSATGSQFTDIVFDNRSNYSLPDYRQYNANGSKEQTAQLDYIDPLKIWTIEAGAKMILRNNYSDFHNDTLNAVNNQYNTENSQTNNFTYHQDVYSLYNSYQLKFTEWIFKGGLRLEHTVINADFASVGSTLNRQYNNLVPSISLLRNLNATSSLTFGFTQRIQRPGIAQLNPFINLSNPQYITVGNPNLSPAINNNFELNYGNFAKGSLNISTHYSFSDNTIQNITTLGANDVTTTTYANIGANKNLGADLSFNYPITKKWNININAELLQVWLKGTYNGTLYTNSGQQGHIFTFASYRSDNGWRFSVNAGFDSRYVLLEGRDNYFFNQSYGVVKEIFNKKGAVYLTIANPFDKFNKLDFFTKTTDFQTYNSNDNYYRMATLGFFYRFGKLKSAIKKNQRGINNDDTVTGGKN